MQRRPGVILSAIALGFLAVAALLFAILMGFAAYTLKAHPASPLQPRFILFFVEALVVLGIGLAIWAVSTVIGLILLKPWARYSILVIGGLFAAFGILSAISIVFVFVAGPILPSTASLPATSTAAVHVILAFVGLFYAVVAAMGVSWLVYFTRRATIDVFRRPDPNVESLVAPRPPSRRPTAITILACLYLFAALTCLSLPSCLCPRSYWALFCRAARATRSTPAWLRLTPRSVLVCCRFAQPPASPQSWSPRWAASTL